MSPRVRAVLEEVAAVHEVGVVDLVSRSRRRDLAIARFDAARRLRTLRNALGEPLSYFRIGQILGGRDHSTVVMGERRGVELFGSYTPATVLDPEETRL